MAPAVAMRIASLKALLALRYRLIWAHARSSKGRIVLLVLGAIAAACVAVLFTLGGIGVAAALLRTARGELVLQLLLSAIFVNATLAGVFVGIRVAPAFSESTLRAYPLTRTDRHVTQHVTALLEPLWLLVLTLVLALAVGASISGAAFAGAAVFAAILLVGTTYMLARALAGVVAWILSFPGGVLLLTMAGAGLIWLPLTPAFLARLAAQRGSLPSTLGVLDLTPPFAAAAAMAFPVSWRVVAALVLLTGWVAGLSILIVLIDRLPRFRRTAAGRAASWDQPCDRIARVAGAGTAPLVSKILRYYVRSAARYNLMLSVPVMALMARHYEEALFAFVLGVAPGLGGAATQPLSANLFGIDGPAVRRYFLLPTSASRVFRATAFVSLALGALVCTAGLLLWLVLAPDPPTGPMVAMVIGAGVGGLLLLHALGLWTTVVSPRTIPFRIAFGNRNSPAANVLMVGSWILLFGLPMVLRQVEEQSLVAIWWAGPGLFVVGATFYIVTIRSGAKTFVTRRERLMELLEEPV